MTPQKRKADAALPAELSDELPHKRIRSESADTTASKQNGTSQSSKATPDDYTKHSVPTPVRSRTSCAGPSKENEAAPLKDLPQTWDKASDADKLLIEMKKKPKIAWVKIEQAWERSTGERPARGMLAERHKRLQGIMADSSSAIQGIVEQEAIEEPSETPDDISTLPTFKVRPLSPVISEQSDKTLRPNSKHPKTTAESSATESAAPAIEFSLEQDLPQSWEQANAGDQLIVRMKTNQNAYARIEKAWEKLTGVKPAKGAVQDRYTRIKELGIRPKPDPAYRHKHQVKASNLDEGFDQPMSRRVKPTPKRACKRKAETEPSDEPSDEFPHESPDEISDEFMHKSKTMARRKPHGTAVQPGRPDEPKAKAGKDAAEEPSDGRAEAGLSGESEEISKHSITVAKSAKPSRVKAAAGAKLGAQNTTETGNEMIVEMRERGCSWPEICEAWTQRTGLTRSAETLRKRYARMKKGSPSKLNYAAQASSKRKMKATSPDAGSYESSAKRSKSTAEDQLATSTPVKRNIDRGKRKSSVKYTDSTTDEDELFAAPVEPAVATSTKRNAGRTAKVNRSDPDWLVTNEKSPLADEDLHAEFSDPKTYENFTKSDWEDLRETLPPNVPVNSDGYSIPMTFFKYDPDFRRGIREFQEDLASGRLDPKWQADAAQAMEERARGKFDAYKEDQFEAFWGQKQKLDHYALAGESMTIKLDLLIQNGIFKVGDYFSYSRVFGRGKNGVLVEKDCKIVKIDGKGLTFAIPPGQRKYSRRMFESGTSEDATTEANATTAGGDDQSPVGVDGKSNGAEAGLNTEVNGGPEPEFSQKGEEISSIEEMAEKGSLPDMEPKEAETQLENKVEEEGTGGPLQSESNGFESNIEPLEDERNEATASEGDKENGSSVETNGDRQPPAVVSQDEDILHSILTLTQLEHKITDTDGRFKSKELHPQNTWRNFRGIRNHQDLGTLFEMREEFYVHKHPQIVKQAKRKR